MSGRRLIGDLATSAASVAEAARRCLAYARHYEEVQDFKAACAALQPFWSDLDAEPSTEGLDTYQAAELLLVAGSLSGWLGRQEQAKDFITRAYETFKALGAAPKVAEALLVLGICYGREGAFKEARVALGEADSLSSEGGGTLQARTLYNLAIIEKSDGQLQEALRLYREAEPLFNALNHHALCSKFYSGYANLIVQLGAAYEGAQPASDKAIELYTASSIFAERTGNVRHQGVIESNLAYLYFKLGLFVEAHDHLDRARKIFLKLQDHTLVDQVDETRGRILIEQKRFADAEYVVGTSVNGFERRGEQSLLAEALTCRGIARARQGKQGGAEDDFHRAAEAANLVGDAKGTGEALITLLEEVPGLGISRQSSTYLEADEALRHSQDIALLSRLRACAARIMRAPTYDRGAKKVVHLESHRQNKLRRGLTLEKARHELDEWLIETTLREAGGNVSEAARRLGITASGLHDKINNDYPRLGDLKRTTHKKEGEVVLLQATEARQSPPIPLRMTSEGLSRRGVHTNDRLIAVDLDIREGDPAAVWWEGRVYVGYYYEYFFNGLRYINLETDEPGRDGWEFARESVEDVKRVVGVVKATDLSKVNPPILPI